MFGRGFLVLDAGVLDLLGDVVDDGRDQGFEFVFADVDEGADQDDQDAAETGQDKDEGHRVVPLASSYLLALFHVQREDGFLVFFVAEAHQVVTVSDGHFALAHPLV